MKTQLTVALALLLIQYAKVTPLLAAPLGQTVAEMASNCRDFRSVNEQSEQLTLENDFSSGVCWGAFQSFHYFVTLISREGAPLLRICPPQSARVATFIGAFLDYADRHPELAREQFSIIAHVAVMRAFPCPANKITIAR